VDPLPTDIAARLDLVERAVRAWRYTAQDEDALQVALAEVFTRASIPFRREVRVACGRFDFLVEPGIAIEVKIKGSLSDLTSQVHRYCGDPSIAAVLVVTTRLNLARLPATISGKPVRVVALAGSSLP
jgi:hypothetical protein